MKHLFILLSLIIGGRLYGISAAGNYTLVDPCSPNVAMADISGTYACFSFTASNALLPGQVSGTYLWEFGDGSTANGTIVAHCYNPTTVTTVYTGTLTFISPALCGALPPSKIFTLSVAPPGPSVCVAKSPDLLISAQSVTVLGGSAIPEMFSSYDFGDGSGFGHDPRHTYNSCGPFVITVKTWDMNFPDDICYSYAGVNLACNNVPAGIPKTIRSVNKVYPNPFSDHIYIEGPKKPSAITAYDCLGKLCRTRITTERERTRLCMEDETRGVFFVKIEYLDNTAEVFKIVKD